MPEDTAKVVSAGQAGSLGGNQPCCTLTLDFRPPGLCNNRGL